MRITNIEWDVSEQDALDEIDAKGIDYAASKIKDFPLGRFVMSKNREDMLRDYFHHRPGALYDLLGLPEEVTILEEVDEDDVAEYIKDDYGS